jgi:hypothetical protein
LFNIPGLDGEFWQQNLRVGDIMMTELELTKRGRKAKPKQGPPEGNVKTP